MYLKFIRPRLFHVRKSYLIKILRCQKFLHTVIIITYDSSLLGIATRSRKRNNLASLSDKLPLRKYSLDFSGTAGTVNGLIPYEKAVRFNPRFKRSVFRNVRLHENIRHPRHDIYVQVQCHKKQDKSQYVYFCFRIALFCVITHHFILPQQLVQYNLISTLLTQSLPVFFSRLLSGLLLFRHMPQKDPVCVPL